jgi:excisionase family DNA binding protein
LRARRPSDGCPGFFSDAANPLPACLGVALDAGEASSEVADDLDGGTPSLFSLDNLSAQAQRVGVLAPMLHSAQRHCTPTWRNFFTPIERFGITGCTGLILMPVTFTRGCIDRERINTLKSANREEGLLSVKDLARVLSCGRTKAWELVNTRQIPSIRVGRLVRISPDDLAEFMREHRN